MYCSWPIVRRVQDAANCQLSRMMDVLTRSLSCIQLCSDSATTLRANCTVGLHYYIAHRCRPSTELYRPRYRPMLRGEVMIIYAESTVRCAISWTLYIFTSWRITDCERRIAKRRQRSVHIADIGITVNIVGYNGVGESVRHHMHWSSSSVWVENSLQNLHSLQWDVSYINEVSSRKCWLFITVDQHHFINTMIHEVFQFSLP